MQTQEQSQGTRRTVVEMGAVAEAAVHLGTVASLIDNPQMVTLPKRA
jgi:hypothetical protein